MVLSTQQKVLIGVATAGVGLLVAALFFNKKAQAATGATTPVDPTIYGGGVQNSLPPAQGGQGPGGLADPTSGVPSGGVVDPTWNEVPPAVVNVMTEQPANNTAAAAAIASKAESEWKKAKIVTGDSPVPGTWKDADGKTLSQLHTDIATKPQVYKDRDGVTQQRMGTKDEIKNLQYQIKQVVRFGPNSKWGVDVPIGWWKHWSDSKYNTGGHPSEALAYAIMAWQESIERTGENPPEDSPLSLAIVYLSAHPELTQFHNGDQRTVTGLTGTWAHWNGPQRLKYAAAVKKNYTGRG